MKNILRKSTLVVLALLPLQVSGAVLITEIMYDLEGADGGYEWVELTNTGEAAVDIGAWRLFENGVNHKFALFAGGTTVLQPGHSAIVADKPDNFVTRFPDVEPVFDSAFSLSNEQETLMLKNGAGKVVDQVTYRSTLGAKGDGASLHLEGEVLTPALPNPGVYPGELLPVQPKAKGEQKPGSSATTFTSGAYAAVGAAPHSKIVTLLPWLLGLVSIIGMGVAAVLLVRAEQQKETNVSADEFEIVES